MKKIKIALGVLAFFLTFNLQAQQDPKIETERLTKLYQKLEGTYQVQIINSREKIAFPLKTLDTIEAKRNATDIVYFWLKDNVRIMILPLATINKKDFAAPEHMVYIPSAQ